jgi:aspartate kinase
MKFGGASLATGEKLLKITNIIEGYRQPGKLVVVVSAMQGVTDSLISIYQKSQGGETEPMLEAINSLREIHFGALKALKLTSQSYCQTLNGLNSLFNELTISLDKTKKSHYDSTVSYGERLSVCLLTAALREKGIRAQEVDSSQIIVTSDDFGNAKPLIGETRKKTKKYLSSLLKRGFVPVVTGFYGSTRKGKIAILGRGGSDYSATLIASALEAKEVILWKEVDGIFTGDPKKNEKVEFIPELSYKEASTLAKKGAKILHLKAMDPVSVKGIVVWIRNILKPEFLGTKIWKKPKQRKTNEKD